MHVVDVLAPYLIGAAATLAVQMLIQLYVVPRVEARKRREDRFERNVLELGDLVTTSLPDRVSKATVGQMVLIDIGKVAETGEHDPARLAQWRENQTRESRQAATALKELVHSRMGLLAGRVIAFRPSAREIASFERAYGVYFLRMAIAVDSEDDKPEDVIEDRWKREYEARTELITQIKELSAMRHPPRVSRRRQLVQWRRRLRQRKREARPLPPASPAAS